MVKCMKAFEGKVTTQPGIEDFRFQAYINSDSAVNVSLEPDCRSQFWFATECGQTVSQVVPMQSVRVVRHAFFDIEIVRELVGGKDRQKR